MRESRRFISMALGALSLILLGFVVAVAARSRPGGPGEESLLDLEIDLAFDMTRILAWIILITAMVGAVLFAVGVKQAKPRQEKKKRNIWAIVAVAAALFVFIRYVRPFAAGLFEAADITETTEAAVEDVSPQSSGNSAWLFSILFAAIVVAALTRVGLTVRGAEASFDIPEAPEPALVGSSWRRAAMPLPLGSDPRSRVLNAYAKFEYAVSLKGVGRRSTETAQRHASRAVEELGMSRDDTSALIAAFSLTRFGRTEITSADAETAELLTAKLCGEIEL